MTLNFPGNVSCEVAFPLVTLKNPQGKWTGGSKLPDDPQEPSPSIVSIEYMNKYRYL